MVTNLMLEAFQVDSKNIRGEKKMAWRSKITRLKLTLECKLCGKSLLYSGAQSTGLHRFTI